MQTGAVMQGKVTVYGHDIMRPPLCDDPDAQMVVIRDASGDPKILLVRLNGDTWGLSTPDDKDWVEMCVRFGLLQPKPVDAVLRSAGVGLVGSH